MSRRHPECPNSEPSDRLVTADVLLRQEPDEEEDEEADEEEDGEENEDEEEDDEGYSELNPPRLCTSSRVLGHEVARSLETACFGD